MEDTHEKWMRRCLQLAALGSGQVAPNPMVGALLLHEGRIIGEGYHASYGQAHAEVNGVGNVPADQRELIGSSTLYVSLEPCSHFGKTPPCTELIISQKIPRVVIGCLDPFADVPGRGVARLREAGVEVLTGVCERECQHLNRRFFTFHQKKRPWVILKWAQSADGFIALPGPRPVKISGVFADRLAHRWRSEEAAILVGATTAILDDPRLTNRLWSGSSPLKIVLDTEGKLPAHLNLFQEGSTLVIGSRKEARSGGVEWVRIPAGENFLETLMATLHHRNILSVLVEGGARVLEAFLDAGIWDEVRVITGGTLLGDGLRAPLLREDAPVHTEVWGGDRLRYFEKNT